METDAGAVLPGISGVFLSKRYRAKLGLIRSLYQRGYLQQAILDLFRFIDWVLALPDGLEDQLWTEIEQLDEEKRMHYLASFERKAHQRGIEQGVGQGQARLLNLLIQQRFGPSSKYLILPQMSYHWGNGKDDKY